MSGAVVYLRISQDRTGQQAGIQRQQEACLALAARIGITDPLVFIDNDVSAFDGGRRPGYDAMVTQVRSRTRYDAPRVGRLCLPRQLHRGPIPSPDAADHRGQL